MSTSAEFHDQEGFDKALSDLRHHDGQMRWLVIGHPDGIPEQLFLQGTGDVVDDLATYLDDTQMQYALVRMEETIDMSVTVKYVYIQWIGSDVAFAKRGRYGICAGFVSGLLSPYHTNVMTSSLEEVTPEYMAEAIGRQSGQISQVREDVEAPQTGASRSAGGPRMPMPQVSLQGAEVDVADNIEDAMNQLRNVESEVNCVAVHYPENNIKKGLEVKHTGTNGVAGITELFTEEAVIFAVIRVIDVVDEIRTVKYVQVKWIGDRVKPMMKAKLATQSGEITRILGSSHVNITASHRNEVTERAVMDRVSAASGSKKVVG